MTEWSQRESTARSNTGEELKGHFQIFKSDNFYSVPKALISVEKWCQTCRQNARWEGWCSLCTRPCRRSPSWAVNLLQPRVKDTLTSLQLLMKINWSYQAKFCHLFEIPHQNMWFVRQAPHHQKLKVTPTFLQLGHCGSIKAGVHWLPSKLDGMLFRQDTHICVSYEQKKHLLDVVGPPDMETNEGVTSAPDWMDNCLCCSLYLSFK